MRVSHGLKANHRSTTLNHLITVDTEANIAQLGDSEQTHTLRLGVAEYWSPARKRQRERQRYCDFTEPAEFWQWAIDQLPKRSAATVIAHNAAYDMRLLAMFRLLPALGFALKKLVLDDPPFIAHWVERCDRCDAVADADGVIQQPKRLRGCKTSAHRSLKVWSTTNLAQLPLEVLAREVGDSKSALPLPTAHSDEWRAYCRQDVVILSRWYRSYVAWLSANDMGNLSPTIGAQAWHAFTHRFMDSPILVHDNAAVLRLERQAYFGGRCECFRLGDLHGEGWTHLDVNALYPYVMSTTYVPTALVTTRIRPELALLERLMSRYCVAARVVLDTPDAIFPTRYNGALCFPTGTFETELTTPELAIALDRGLVRSCSYAAIYDRKLAFKRYVGALWALRCAARLRGDRIGDLICKLLMNSLYGKFGQRSARWLPIGATNPGDAGVLDEWDVTQQRWRTIRWVGGQVYEKQEPEEGTDSFPAIAAHITAAARVHMWRLLERVHRFDVAYMDTDSLIVNAHGLAALRDLIAPAELGGLRIVRQHDDLVVRGPKWYYHGPDVVTKGVKLDAEWYHQDGVSQWHWHGLHWSIEHNAVDTVQLERVRKDFKFEYGKGSVSEDGRVFPLVLA